MLSKYVVPGDKIELRMVSNNQIEDDQDKVKVYYSQVYDINSDDRLEITMPMEKTKLILLPVDSEYDLHVFTKSGLLQCFVRILDRYKSNNVYILALELVSNLRKHQRREYYRFSCALEMDARPLQEEEIVAIDKNKDFLVPGLPLKRSIVVDISGGGLRFVADQKYDVESLIYCSYRMMIDNNMKEYNVIGKVLRVNEIESHPGEFEHRVQYVNLEKSEREEIIKFIFEEERKNRQKGLK